MALLRGHWQLIVLTTLLFALWQTPVVAPLKILIVYLHELSHVIAILATGGSVESLTVNADEGGLVISRGGNRFLSLSAGYQGSLLIGALLFTAAVRTHADRAVLGILGGFILLTTVLYSRELFALGFGLITGFAMLAIARFLPRDYSDLMLRVIGLASMIYVPYDIFSDTIQHSYLRSDARMLAEEFGGATMMWGALWIVLSLGVLALCLRYGLGADSNIRPANKSRYRT
ncbi:M50 family metallopeptidase [Tropicibacter sp. R16_0]|uniref:M50 family metallopeptidase n=1 Tax=Tropicibacter sp. R16_0 TaxID=2821102 RepID=UPI001AD9C12A|nr:M50 family metallopeptidase [Tropicibacter sp. R16_0]MBO9450111.1 M50 family metallopeptidase [Tropicibacter sp. R16_0]